MVLVPDDRALDAVDDGFLPGGVGGDAGVADGEILLRPVVELADAVGLHIGLGDHIKAVLVAELGEEGGVGVMAGADGVDVVLLHEAQVGEHLLGGDGIAVHRVGIVAVDAAELDVLAIQIKDAVLSLDLPKADLLADGLAGGGEGEGVEGGVLGVPEVRLFDRDGERAVRLAGGDFAAAGSGQGVAHRHLLPGKIKGNLDPGGGVISRQRGADGEITDVVLRPLEEVDVPEDAAHPQLVLVLEVAAVAPFQDEDGDGVFAGAEKFRHLKLAGRVGDLAVSHQFAVYPEVEAGVDPLEIHVVAEIPFLADAEVADIGPAGIFERDIGRVVGEGVADVGVLVAVVAVILPDRGDGDLFKAAAAFRVPLLALDGADVFVVAEVPLAAQELEAVRLSAAGKGGGALRGGDVVGAVGFGVQVENAEIFKVIWHDHGHTSFRFPAAGDLLRPFLYYSAKTFLFP